MVWIMLRGAKEKRQCVEQSVGRANLWARREIKKVCSLALGIEGGSICRAAREVK